MPTTLAQRKYDAFPQDYEQDLYAAFEPPHPEVVHCWHTFGPWARLGKQGPWKRAMCSLWLIGPKKGALPL